MSTTDHSPAGTSKSFSNNLQYLNLVIHHAHNFHLLFDNKASVNLDQVRNARNKFGNTYVNGEHESVRRYQETSSCDNYGTLINEQLWNRPVEDRHFTSDSPGLIASLDLCWSEARLQHCTNDACLKYKQDMDAIVPRCQQCGKGKCTCGYGAFRSNTTTAMSCQLALCPDPLEKAIETDTDFQAICDEFVGSKAIAVHTHIANFVAACVEILKFYTDEATKQQEDNYCDNNHLLLLNVSNVIHWMANIQYEKGIGLVGFGSWTSKIAIAPAVRRRIWDACTKAQGLKICEHRLWTLIRVSDRKEADVPDIVDALVQYQGRQGCDMRWLHDQRKCCRETVNEGENCPSHPLEGPECCLQIHNSEETCLRLKHTRCSSSKCQTTTMNSSEVQDPHRQTCGSACQWQDNGSEKKFETNHGKGEEELNKWVVRRDRMMTQPIKQSGAQVWDHLIRRTSDKARKEIRTYMERGQAESKVSVAEKPAHKSFRDFCTEKTSEAVRKNLPTAWVFPDGPLEKPSTLAAPNAPYVALSHVWSDGTGTATPCMLQFLKRMAQTVSSGDRRCNAIWWDAISVPTDQMRAKALETMNDNYRRAYCTIVHDKQLMKYRWERKEDICLALVLSTWFTRAWTAMELAVSPKVKVLVRNHDDPDNPIPLDLDDEILAFGPERVSRAHWIAKAWIRRLREPVDDVGDISAILSRRTSKYPRDQTVIAALLADVPDLQTEVSEAEILEKTLLYLGKVPYAGLMHGQPTLTNSKGFSWSPCAVSDMEIGLPADIESRAASDYFGMLDVFQGGSVRGEWQMEYIDKSTVEHLHNVSTDMSLKLKVASALNDPLKCLLLRPSSESEKNALLVGFIQVDDKSGYVQCCYIGLVSYDLELSFNRACQFIIGSRDGSYGVRDAKQAIEGSRLGSEAEDIDETPMPDSLGPGHEDSDTTDAFKSAIEENSEPAMRYLLCSSGWKPLTGRRNNKELFTRPWRRSEIQRSHGTTGIYGCLIWGLLLLELNKEKHLAYAKSAYQSAYSRFQKLPQTKASEDILLFRERLLVKAHICHFRGHLEYPSKDSDDPRGAIEGFKQVLRLQDFQKSVRFSGDAALQLDDHAVFQEGFGLNTSQHETSQWKRLQLDSLVRLTLLHIGLDDWDQAAETFFEVIRHFTKDESGQSGSEATQEVRQKHLGVLNMALKLPEPPVGRSAPANDQPPIPDDDQQRIPINHILSFYHIASKALAAFSTIFRRNHLLIDLTNFYIGRAFHLLSFSPDDHTPAPWVKALGTKYLESAKTGLENRPVFIPRAIRTRIGHSLKELSEPMQLPQPIEN